MRKTLMLLLVLVLLPAVSVSSATQDHVSGALVLNSVVIVYDEGVVSGAWAPVIANDGSSQMCFFPARYARMFARALDKELGDLTLLRVSLRGEFCRCSLSYVFHPIASEVSPPVVHFDGGGVDMLVFRVKRITNSFLVYPLQ